MNSNDQIAVFLDIENFIGFSHSLQLPVDLSEVLEKLKEEGRIIIRRSFGDLVKALAGNYQIKETDNVRRMLRDNLFVHEDISYHNQFKNSADMRLAVEMLYTAFTIPTITKFAVIAGDSDYVPVFQKLQEQNKTVIGISGNESGTSVIYRRACDSIYYFEDILRPIGEHRQPEESKNFAAENQIKPDKESKKSAAPKSATTSTSTVVEPPTAKQVPPVPQISFDYQAIRDDYANLLVRSVKILEQSGKAATLMNIFQQMRQLQADFNYERAGYESFQDLARFAAEQNLIVIEQQNGSVNIYLPDSKATTSRNVSTTIYRKFIQSWLKCQLPTARIRRLICDKAEEIIGYNSDDGGLLLNDLSADVTDELLGSEINVPQPEVYKYLLSLYRSRCFEYEDSERGTYNPFITGYRIQKEQWDDRFITFQIRKLNEENLPLVPQKLSALFFETEEKTLYIKQMLNKEGIKFESQ
jgi:uncharacterized LabA/DUF88 family protein